MESEKLVYKVVINHEEQYAVWLVDMKNEGWKDAGVQGTLEECTKYVQEAWQDMRPLSLRERLEKM